MHLLTWVGFGLLGYVPNTLYSTSPACITGKRKEIQYKITVT
jgi:hypothetical protein